MAKFKTLVVGLTTMVCAMTASEASSQHDQHDQHKHHDHMHKRFEDAKKWAAKFDDPKRDEWQKPDAVVAALDIGETAVVADIGAGTGYFAVRMAKHRPNAKIIAVDVEPDMVAYIKERAQHVGCKNIETQLVSADEGVKLGEPADLIIVVDTYHHIGEREKYFITLAQSLKPDGRLAIIDFKLDSPEGPPAEHRIPPEKIKDELASAGYSQTKSIDILPYQYFLMFQRKTQ